MSKYSKPLYVVAWEMHPTMPRCCWTCQHFDEEAAHCAKYRMDVPKDFADQEERCADWIDRDGVPF